MEKSAETSSTSPRLLDLEAPGAHILIREQLERILDSPAFGSSKRYPRMLRYVVDYAIAGQPERLKERCLGVEVFGRAPDYDTAADPVVRMSAAEIRKRIAQYYDDAAHQSELRLELPLGSYVPVFHMPNGETGENRPEAQDTGVEIAGSPGDGSKRRLAELSLFPRLKPVVKHPRMVVRAVLVVVVAGAAVAALLPRRTALDRFWAPLVNDPNPVLLCAGRSPGSTADGNPPAVRNGVIGWSDVVTLTRVAQYFGDHKHPIQLRREDRASFTDLRGGPAVLVGGFNDAWTMRLIKGGRYELAGDESGLWIVDRQSRTRKWGVPASPAAVKNMREDFALVTRVHDPNTGNVVVAAAGLWGHGTEAAGEFLTSEKAMQTVLDAAGENWDSRNIQVVLRTAIIDGGGGPPQVIATWFW